VTAGSFLYRHLIMQSAATELQVEAIVAGARFQVALAAERAVSARTVQNDGRQVGLRLHHTSERTVGGSR
jgi:hypothetical protein